MIFWENVVNLLDILLGDTLENEPAIARLIVRDAGFVRFVQRYRWFSQRILEKVSRSNLIRAAVTDGGLPENCCREPSSILGKHGRRVDNTL